MKILWLIQDLHLTSTDLTQLCILGVYYFNLNTYSWDYKPSADDP